MNTGIGDQVGLEFVQVDVQRAVKSQRRCDGADNLRDKSVEVIVTRTRNIQVAAANIVNCLIINQEGTVRVLDRAVGGKDGIVGFNDGGRHSRGRVNRELELRLLSVIGRQPLEQQSSETRTSTTAERVENKEPLKGRAVVYGRQQRVARYLNAK